MSGQADRYSTLDREVHLHSFTDLSQNEKSGALIIDRGEGIYLIDADGNRYLDAMASLWCATLGYSETRLVEAAERQMSRLPYSHTFRGRSHPVLIDLAQKLVSMAPSHLTRAFFAGSGSEANESAVKMAWAYHKQNGCPEKRKIISRTNAYHGSTIFASRLCGMPSMHEYVNAEIPEVIFVDQPHYAVEAFAGESETEFVARLTRQLEDQIQMVGARHIAAFIAEPVMGVGGVILPPADYFEQIHAVLKRHDILLIADEVICGFGRTGDLFGSISFNFKPDIMTLAKGITSAYFPLSAVLLTESVYSALRDTTASKGVFAHGFTYSGHPVGAAVALEALAIIEERDIPGHVRTVSSAFQDSIAALDEFDMIVNPRGIGLMAGFDLVNDDAQAFAAEMGAGALLMDTAERHGLLIRAVGDTIVLAPPLIIDAAEIEELISRLRASIEAVMATLRHDTPTSIPREMSG